MKFQALGVKVLNGVSKKTGDDFVMAFVYGSQPIEVFKKGDFEAKGYGSEPLEIPLDAEALEKFKGVKFPCEIDLETDAVPRFGKFETIVIGFRPVAVQKAA